MAHKATVVKRHDAEFKVDGKTAYCDLGVTLARWEGDVITPPYTDMVDHWVKITYVCDDDGDSILSGKQRADVLAQGYCYIRDNWDTFTQ